MAVLCLLATTAATTAHARDSTPATTSPPEALAPRDARGDGVLAQAEVLLVPDDGTVPFGGTAQATVVARGSEASGLRVTRIDPPKSQDMPGAFVHASGRLETIESASGGVEWRRTFVLRLVAEGEVEIPSFTVRYRVGDSRETETLPTPPRRVRVMPDPLAEGEARGVLNPPAPPQSIPYDWTLRNLFIAGVAIAALALAAAVAWLMRRWATHREAMRPPAPPRPEHLVAYDALNALEKSTFLRDGRFKEYFSALSEILRRYVGARYGVPAPDWTTFEIQEALYRRSEPGEPALLRLVAILETCDLVKFAKWKPPEGSGEHALDEARRFVDLTLRRPSDAAQGHPARAVASGASATKEAA